MEKQAGFTLIEIIATLVIVGILTAIAGMGIVQVLRGYETTRENARISQQAQLAISRINKEIIELIDIPAASTSTSISIKNITGTRTLGLYAPDNTIRINDTGGAISSGDILIEGVNAFTLAYWAGDPAVSSASWTPGTNIIQQLKFIDVNLRLNRQGGGYLEFATRVAPRNNKNAGGTAPTSPPPAAPSYGCFIATAAYGNADHPAVIVLRDFRDQLLSSWSGGRFLVRLYTSYSPCLAEKIRENQTAMIFTRILLIPVTLFALFVLYAPLTLVLVPLITPPLLKILAHKHRLRTGTLGVHGSNGTVLLSLLMTMVLMAILIAAMLPIYSSSKFTQVYADQGAKAYFLAESGFRYAASVYLNAGNDSARFTALRNLNRKTCTLLNNDGAFTLIVYPYWYRTYSVSGSSLTVELPGEFDATNPTQVSLPTAGYLKIGSSYFNYTASSGGAAASTTLTFTGTWTGVTAGNEVNNVVLPSASQTVTQHGNVTLSATGVSILPVINGNFTLNPAPTGTSGSTIYTYESRSGNTLYNVDLVDPSQGWRDLALVSGAITNASTTKIIMTKYLRLPSTGTYGPSSREIIYNVPIGWVAGGQGFRQEQYQDAFNTTANWQAPSGGGGFGGTHSIQSIDGSSALKVDSAPSSGAWWTNTGNWATMFFNWGSTNANLAQSWLDSQGCLSYDLQVKVRNDQPYFFAGLNFRMRNNSDNTDLYDYGVSFIKPRQQRYKFLGIGSWSAWAAPSDLTTALIPGYVSDASPGPLFSGSLEQSSSYWQGWWQVQDQYGLPSIVLWERTSSGFRWLAYRTLTATDGIVTYTSATNAYRLVNWSTLMVRVIEGYPLSFSNGGGTSGTGVPIKSGDTISTSDGSKSARVTGTPILTGGSWAGRSAQGTFTLSSVTGGTFASGDILYVNGVQLAQAAGPLVTPKQNYFRVYYTAPTALGTANAIQTDNNRLANARGSENWPPDDLTDLTAANDYVTMIGGTSGLQWTGYNTGVSALTSTSEPNAVIANGDLVTPAWSSSSTVANFAFANGNTGDSLAVVTSSASATSTYYDDFGIQFFLKAGTGFLPPIQQ